MFGKETSKPLIEDSIYYTEKEISIFFDGAKIKLLREVFDQPDGYYTVNKIEGSSIPEVTIAHKRIGGLAKTSSEEKKVFSKAELIRALIF